MKYKKAFLIFLQISITVILFFVVLSKIKSEEIAGYILKADLRYLFLAVILVVANQISFLTLKYKEILGFLNCRISYKIAMIIKLGAIPLGMLVPFKAGKALRLVYLKNFGIAYKKGIFLIILEYALTVVALLQIFVLGITPYSFLIFIITVFIAFIRSRNVAKAYLFSFMYEGIRVAYVVLIFLSFGIKLSMIEIFTGIPVILFLSGLPLTISGFGVREMSAVFLFSSIMYTKENIFAAALMLSFYEFVVPLIVGTVFLKKFMNGLIKDESTCKR